MTATAVIVIEGVLQHHNGDGVMPQGARLYHALREVCNVVLVSNREDEDRVQFWLKINGFTEHGLLLPALITDPEEVGGTRLRQVASIRGTQATIEMVIEPDPAVASVLLAQGIPVLVYLHPKYSAPEHRPDWRGAVRPWANLVAEVTRQEEIRAADSRSTQDDL